MSSHHFVKEGQEPAIFITESLSLELIEPLLEWAPLVMITDELIDDVIRWGFKIDVVVAQTANQEIVADKMAAQVPFKIIPYQDEENSVIAGFNYLLNQNQQAVHVISSSPEIFSVIHDFITRLDVTILNESARWSYSKNGEYDKWLPAASKIKLKRSVEKQVLTFHLLKEDDDGIFEAVKDGIVEVRSKDPFWIGEIL
ncbi:MAG TPA: hypothetical protein VL443_07755 [Cyclobacteriaceae bacterium]|nr:hypothetical protein [Cyclobacteriaceae bacterium]